MVKGGERRDPAEQRRPGRAGSPRSAGTAEGFQRREAKGVPCSTLHSPPSATPS